MKYKLQTAPDNRFFQLPFHFNPVRLKTDLECCEAARWIAHFNTNDYQGEWSGMALRSATGSVSDIRVESPDAFIDTPLLHQCSYFQEIISSFACPVETVRLLALAPGSIIKEHRDPGLGYPHGRFRLHIPITTDPDVAFMVDGQPLQMEAGQCWYADFSLPHSVTHSGTTRRIHLVIDGVRNTWTDDLFGRCGYSFEAEKKHTGYDAATVKEMILHLRRMDTDTARALIAELESGTQIEKEIAPKENTLTPEALQDGWLPVAVQQSKEGWLLKWQYIGGPPYTEPFFHETIRKTRHLSNNKVNPDVCTPWSALISLAASLEHVPPAAIIFHTSRCGSTLLTQLLACDEDILVLSEVPVLDSFLRMPYQASGLSQDEGDHLYSAFISLAAQPMHQKGKPLFIKSDSWNVFSCDRLRRLYPDTPFLLMYRHPDDILRSHEWHPGLQTIPSMLEPHYTNVSGPGEGVPHATSYLHQLLLQIFQKMIRITAIDPNSHLISYHEGWEQMIRITEKATGIQISKTTRDKMTSRSRYHSKKPYEPVQNESIYTSKATSSPELVELYLQLEQIKHKQRGFSSTT